MKRYCFVVGDYLQLYFWKNF